MKKIVKIIFINAVILLALLVILELILRFSGAKPIFYRDKGESSNTEKYKHICRVFKQKKEIKIFPSYFTDSDGIFRVDTSLVKGGKYQLAEGAVINSAGFRGHAFKYLQTGKKKIFFIGDSFTWGAMARPLTKSFPDLVERAGYYVYNGGMPGTDPLQYARLAEKYVPLLKPDVTAVCLYLGNDLKGYVRALEPNKNLHYNTDIGFILGYDDRGVYFHDAGQAIDYLKKQKCGCTDNLGEAFLYKTIIGKAVYNLFHLQNYLKPDPKRLWVKESLEKILRVCRQNGSRFMLFLLPHKDPERSRRGLKLVTSFWGSAYYYPEQFKISDYSPPPDRHFNNRGHRKYARFIVKTLKKEGFMPGKRK